MQLCNATVRHGGSLLHTVHKTGITPGEILILKHIHGQDAVVDIRPTSFSKSIRQSEEFDRLAHTYDRASAFSGSPGETSKSLMSTLFPGAMKKLPTTLEEIGLGNLLSPAARRAAAAIDAAILPDPDESKAPLVSAPLAPREVDADETDGGDGNDEGAEDNG